MASNWYDFVSCNDVSDVFIDKFLGDKATGYIIPLNNFTFENLVSWNFMLLIYFENPLLAGYTWKMLNMAGLSTT